MNHPDIKSFVKCVNLACGFGHLVTYHAGTFTAYIRFLSYYEGIILVNPLSGPVIRCNVTDCVESTFQFASKNSPYSITSIFPTYGS